MNKHLHNLISKVTGGVFDLIQSLAFRQGSADEGPLVCSLLSKAGEGVLRKTAAGLEGLTFFFCGFEGFMVVLVVFWWLYCFFPRLLKHDPLESSWISGVWIGHRARDP